MPAKQSVVLAICASTTSMTSPRQMHPILSWLLNSNSGVGLMRLEWRKVDFVNHFPGVRPNDDKFSVSC